MLCASPFARLPMLQLKLGFAAFSTSPALSAQLPLLAVTSVTTNPGSPAGNVKVSVTVTFCATDGPLLRYESTKVAVSPALTDVGDTDFAVICTSASGSMVTVSEALLFAEFGSPSRVLVTVAVLVKLPSVNGRFTVIGIVTVWPRASTPAVCVQRTFSAVTTQSNFAVLPADTLATTGVVTRLRPLMKAGTLSLMRTPVASSFVLEALVTTSVYVTVDSRLETILSAPVGVEVCLLMARSGRTTVDDTPAVAQLLLEFGSPSSGARPVMPSAAAPAGSVPLAQASFVTVPLAVARVVIVRRRNKPGSVPVELAASQMTKSPF